MTKHIKKVSGLSRREVLVGSAAGAGLVIGYSVLPNAVDSASKAIAAGNWDHQQFLSMDADGKATVHVTKCEICLLYTSPSPRDISGSRMPSSA